MSELDRALLRKLAEWSPGAHPVTSVYLSTDGRVYPRAKDYELRLDDLLRRARRQAEALGREQSRSVEKDAKTILSFVADRFDRGRTRGLALFSCSAAGLWEDLALSRPVRNLAVAGPHPDLLQLESILETYESFCTALVDGRDARIFLAELGRIEERSDLEDEVPSRHDQGGWSQARFQRHVDEHRQRHMKHTAAVLFRLLKRRGFDHLILAGPEGVLAEFEPELHDYLRQRIRARIHLPMTASGDEVLARSLELEEELERDRIRGDVDRLKAETAAGRQGVAGLGPTLRALEETRAGALLVAPGLQVSGRECTSCGRLAERGRRCQTCGGKTIEVPDLVEAAAAAALRQGCRVETVPDEEALRAEGGIGALLRF